MHLLHFACAAALLFSPIAARDIAPQPPQGFEPLFNGKDLSGWWGMGTKDPRPLLTMDGDQRKATYAKTIDDIQSHWRVENGELVNDGKGLYLTTERLYGDFELLVDYKTVAKADSGIYLRGLPQVQIWDTTKAGGKWNIGANFGSGGLWNNSPGANGKDPLVHADRPFGEWNSFRIRMVGDYVTVFLNDKLVVNDARLENYFDRGAPLPTKGPIQLQTHGGEIRWRNVFLREIPSDEANAYLRSLDGERSASLFNGKDLKGWKGAVDNYEVVDGAVRCKKGKGGVIWHEGEFENFVVDFEFQLPPGGNNGLAIRYGGKGDPAYAGMCELQVLDNTHPKYAKLDARQYHGSAYGMVAAKRGMQRPVGEWNFQRVRVLGQTIQVDLNGARILDADLSKVTEFMGGRPHPGLTQDGKHFGFCGHGDPVAFRNIRMRRLPDAGER